MSIIFKSSLRALGALLAITAVGACVAPDADLAEVMDLETMPLDEMGMRDLSNEGHDLATPDEIDFANVEEETGELRREDVPPEVLEELERIERERLIPKDLIGLNEGRTPISNSRESPYRTIVKLYTQYTKGGKTRGCSGSLIAPDAVLTAAHCVFHSGRSVTGYAYSVTVIPGMYPKSPMPSSGLPYETPYGTAAGAKLFVPSRYIDNESDEWNRVAHDYAVIRLKSSLGAAGTRTFGVMASPLNKTIILTGYHSDKELSLRQYTSQDQVRKVFDDGIINHYADSEHGASGSGITGTGAWANKIFAVHSSGFGSYNSAALITDSNYRVIVDWAVRAL